MTFHNRPHVVKAAAAHLLDRAIKTKGEGGGGDDPLELIAKKFGDHAAEVMKKLGASNTELRVLKEQFANLEQKIAEGGGTPSGPVEIATLGKQFVESERFKSFIESGGHQSAHGKVDLRIKTTLTSLTTDAAGSVGGATNPAYRDGMALLRQRRLRIRDLIPTIHIESGSVEVPVQKVRTLNAGMVAEGGSKPESDMQFEMKTFSARTIAHWMKASRQVLDDAPQLRGVIDNDLTYGLGLKEESQLLSGDNSGQNLYGMIPQATAYAAPVVIADINIIDVIGLAALQAALSEYAADGAIIHPSDWLSMRLLKNSQGDYIFGPPNSPVEPRVFGMPLVPTQAMTARKFLVGEFQVAATIYDRWEARVEAGFVNDDFIKNLVTLLGEERLAFAVKRPDALIYGDFDTALAA
jgi:HK97 family phage major capsid protein